MMAHTLWCWLAFVAASPIQLWGADWPQWRGPSGQGHAFSTGFPTVWSETHNVAWKTMIPGRGWSSPVVWGDQIWLTTAIEVPAAPEDVERRLKANTGGQPLTLLETVELRAICIERGTGVMKENILLLREPEPQWVHQQNSYASPTPVIEAGRLYCHFGTLGTFCVNTVTGKMVWKNTRLNVMHENGPGSSPVLVGEELYFLSDSGGLLTCLDARSGQEHYRERLGGNYSASPTCAGGKIYCSSREGVTSVIEPGKQFRRVAENSLSGKIFTSLAAVDGAFFLRTDSALYRIEELGR